MELSPHTVASATFRTVKKGYDPDEVRSYLVEVSSALEAAQQQAAAMEARARAAIAKLQEAQTTPSADDADTISRTLLLAQRTADATIADAQAQAERLRADAEDEAGRVLQEAKDEAQRMRDERHLRLADEIAELTDSKMRLTGEIQQLNTDLRAQRDRVREASAALAVLADRVPALIEVAPALGTAESGSGLESESSADVDTGELPLPDGPMHVADITPPTGADRPGI